MATRNRRPSNAVQGSIVAGSPLAILTGYIVGAIAAKNPTIPPEVIGAGIAAAASWGTSLFAYLKRGGRKGEAE